MNLLLLLSALLSALTGAGVSARAPQVAVTVSQVVATTVAVRPSSTRLTGVPVASVPSPAATAALVAAPTLPLMAIEPIYLSRRRE